MNAYLDYNATAPLRPEVAQAVSEALAIGGNASSVHSRGREARRVVEEARDKVAALTGASPAEIVFTGSGTEANNLALSGGAYDHVLVSAVEHDSVLKARADAHFLKVTETGMVDLENLDSRLSAQTGTSLVSVMTANNETGVRQPIERIAELTREHGAVLHTDAVQAAGKISLDRAILGVQMISLSAHKLGGPQGVGALIVTDDVALQPLLKGGGQERSRRAGTENVAGIAGFGVAAELALQDLNAGQVTASLRDRLETEILSISPETRIVGHNSERLPNTSCLTMPGVDSETQIMSLDLAGVMVSAGSACSSGKVATSHVLTAMGLSDAEASTAVRVSFGWDSQEQDIDAFVAAWADLYHRTRRSQLEASAA